MNDYGAHATGLIPNAREPKKPRKVRALASDFVKRPAEELIAEYGELVDEVEASIAKARMFLAEES